MNRLEAPVEADRASFWEPISDAWSRIWFAFSKWRFGHGQWRRYLFWLMAVPLLVMAARLLAAKGWRRAHKPARPQAALVFRSGLDSEFYLIDKRLAQLGLGRRGDETALAWLRRITVSRTVNASGLNDLLALHYRLRFDPDGIGSQDRAALRSAVQQWLDAFERVH